MLSGVCHRYPNLDFVSVENGAGWLPFLGESMDWLWLVVPLGIFAGALTTIAGIGGGLVITLVLAAVWEPHLALAVSAPALLLGNVHRLLLLRAEIDRLNEVIYANVNNGVYRCGFASTQEAYEEAFLDLFGTLDRLEQRLSRQRYLAGHRITEADWRLFTTLIRFDAVYYSHFKCNLRRISDYPNLSYYLRDLYQQPGVAATVNMDHIKRHYYGSQRAVNPTGIVPLGPALDFMAPHDRARFGA